MEKIDKVCQSHGLRFANRITYVDRYTLHITGKVIPHGSYRNGYPISSQYNERKKIFSNRSLNWMKKYEASGKTKCNETSYLIQNNLSKNVKCVNERELLF